MGNKKVSSNKKNAVNSNSNVKKKNTVKKDSSRIGFLLFIVVMFLVILVSTVFGDLQQIVYNKEQTKVLNSKYTGLLEEEASLNSEVNKLQDADYIERYAREKYMYTLDGEKIPETPETKVANITGTKTVDKKEAKVGEIYTAEVVRIEKYGVFCKLWEGCEGLCHISRLAKERVEKCENVVSIGDQIIVKCISIDEKGRVDLSRKDALTNVSKPAADAE